ncbi:MAG: (Fe-S)-binding protein [Chloroflexota bacterium]
METISVFREGIEALGEAGGWDVRLCYQCSLCTASCPWNSVRTFMLRRMLRESQFGLVDLGSEDWWLCMTCGQCTVRCPRGVPIIDVMKAVRRLLVGSGTAPARLHSAMTSLSSLGNPWLQEREKRTDWAGGLGVKRFTSGMELLYFSCCTAAYDPRAMGIARATVRVLQKAGVDFGILGSAEVCCGESARKAGNESLFRSLAQTNIESFGRNGVTRVLTSSPHCYYSFRNEYPQLGAAFEVVHFTQYLWGLVSQGRLKFSRGTKLRVAYHDPCYLGRHSGVYDEPRRVLGSIPGVELVELPDSRETALCCGGGGGRIWMETKVGERFSDIRLEQTRSVGAELLVTACPYCLLNLDASVAAGAEGRGGVGVKDISELVAEAV